MDAQTKEKLVAELRDYLDTMPEESPADSGANGAHETAREIDLYTLFTELAGLRSEIHLESRQIKRALDEFNGVFATLGDDRKRLGNALDAQQKNQAAAVANAERALLLEMIDLRDRLAQARALAANHKPGLFARLLARRQSALLADVGEGLGITLRRLDQALARYDVVPIQALGRALDPHRMRVTTVRSDPAQADGSVLEEVRRGYQHGDETVRLAEVVANKLQN